jgi:DNA-binding response OmpR family regulator
MRETSGTLPLLLASPRRRDYERFRVLSEESGWQLTWVARCQEITASFLASRPAVVLTAACLPDGDWRTVRWITWDLIEPPVLIVLSVPLSPREYSRAKQLDVDQLVIRPYNEFDALRAITHAWRKWCSQHV